MGNKSINKASQNASKSSHIHIINDKDVIQYLTDCNLPKDGKEIDFDFENTVIEIKDVNNPIKIVIAVDGGYTQVNVKKNFPSSEIAFFQFGGLFFEIEHLEAISKKPFIFPEDMAKFKDLERYKLVLPIKNITHKAKGSLVDSIRIAIFDFFIEKKFIETLDWFIYEEYNELLDSYDLASCPNPECKKTSIPLNKNSQSEKYTYECPECKSVLYLTDIFRLHEKIDEEIGAESILGLVTNLIEHFILIHSIKYIYEHVPSRLEQILFIKDGPLAFFDRTANMHNPMRHLCNFLQKKHNLYLVGIEKSGLFVDHASAITKDYYDESNIEKIPNVARTKPKFDESKSRLKPGDIFLLKNDYIYKYIMPGDPTIPYARSSYYSGKLIYKSRNNTVFVATIPISNYKIILNPTKEDFKNLDVILLNLEKLKCDMYDNSIIPVALADHLVSLANHPSSAILEKFAINRVVHKSSQYK